MLPKWHFIAAAVSSAILSLFWSWWQILLFFTAAFFIDVDHYLYFVWKKKSWSLKKAYEYWIVLGNKSGKRKEEKIQEYLVIFHTIEVFIVLAVLAFVSFKIFFPMLLGFVIHNIFDVATMIKTKEKRYKRACSLIFYAVKNAKK